MRSVIITTISIAFVLIVSYRLYIQTTHAQEDPENPQVTESPVEGSQATDSASPDASDIRRLRDRLASVVAQLRKKDEQVTVGEVQSITDNVIKIDTIAGSTQQITLDETLTKYFRISGAAKEEIELKDVSVGSYVIVTGMQTEGTFTANEIYLDEHFESKAGRVTEVDADNGTLRVETFDKDTLTVIIGRSVVQEKLNVISLSLSAVSFSEIREGDTVHIMYPVSSIKAPVTSVTPLRILVIPVAYFNR